MNNYATDATVDMSTITRFAVAGLAEYKIDSIKNTLSNNAISKERASGLTVSLLEASKRSHNNRALIEIAKCINVWEENRELEELRQSILTSYADKQDIASIYLCKDNQIVSFIVVMDDSTQDTVFEYNEIGFNLSEKYRAIEDFMIIDSSEAAGCLGLLSNYNLIYKRG